MLSASAVRALRDAANETLGRTRRHGLKLVALAPVFIVLALLTRQRGENDLGEIDIALKLWAVSIAIFLGSIFGGALLAGWHLRRRASFD